MARNTKNLQSKKSWTGEEVGKALISNLLNDIKNRWEPCQPLFTQADFNEMERSLKTERDYLIYDIYKDIYGAIIDSFNREQGLRHQFYHGYCRLSQTFREMQRIERMQRIRSFSPLMIT